MFFEDEPTHTIKNEIGNKKIKSNKTEESLFKKPAYCMKESPHKGG